MDPLVVDPLAVKARQTIDLVHGLVNSLSAVGESMGFGLFKVAFKMTKILSFSPTMKRDGISSPYPPSAQPQNTPTKPITDLDLGIQLSH